MTNGTTTTRRAILAGAASLPALAIPAAAMAGPDPIFAAIDDHRRLYEKLNSLAHRHGELERSIPAERRVAYHVEDRGTDAGKNDDPRWTAFQDDYWACSDAEQTSAIELLNIKPTTLQGVAALLLYARDHEISGAEWPDHLVDDGGDLVANLTLHLVHLQMGPANCHRFCHRRCFAAVYRGLLPFPVTDEKSRKDRTHGAV